MIKKSKRDITHIVVHCTATKEGYEFSAKDIDKWHRSKGWAEIGYNYVVQLDGSIQEGRSVDKVPAHVQGHNSKSIGIVYVGGLDDNMNPKDTRTEAQKQSLRSLIASLKIVYPKAQVLGHRDFPGVRKACPCFNAKNEYQ